jgi:uncharacterized protein YbjT (DUF2867 family)
MRILIFSATGMVGQGVLHEALRDPDVTEVLSVGRSQTGVEDPKLRELVPHDLFDLSGYVAELSDFDACFFCLGVSSVGLTEANYIRITHDLTLSIANTLATINPDLAFLYISGASTDAEGRAMWMRVKGRTENELLALFPRAVMLRPAYIQPMPGVRSKTRLYRAIYAAARPLYPLLRQLGPAFATSSEQLGRSMLSVAKHGSAKRILESRDINAL